MKNYYKIFLLLVMAVFTANVFAQQTVEIKKTADPITIDGNADEAVWTAEGVVTLTPQSIIGEEAPDGEYDFSAEFKVLWNDTAIFFLVTTKDMDWYPNDHWASDQVETYFRFGTAEVTGNDIYDDGVNGIFQVPFRTTEDGIATGGYKWDPSYYGVATIETNDGWQMEAYATWDLFISNMTGDVDPPTIAPGLSFNLDLNIQDNDSDPEGDDYPGNFTQGYWSSASHLWGTDWSTAGEATLSADIVKIADVAIKEKFVVYPSPASDNIRFSEKIDEVKIYNILGKEVLSKPVTHGYLSIADLSTGIYVVQLKKHNKVVAIQKLQVK